MSRRANDHNIGVQHITIIYVLNSEIANYQINLDTSKVNVLAIISMIVVVSVPSGVVYGQIGCVSANNCTSDSEIIIPFDKDIIAAGNQEDPNDDQKDIVSTDNNEDNPLVLPFP